MLLLFYMLDSYRTQIKTFDMQESFRVFLCVFVNICTELMENTAVEVNTASISYYITDFI